MSLIWLLMLMLAQPLLPDTPQVISLQGGEGPALLAYTAPQPQTVTITARGLDAEPVDVTLEILHEGRRLAFNDDHLTGRDDLRPQDAALEALRLPAGDYLIRIHSFNGAQTGAVEALLVVLPDAPPCQTPAQIIRLYRGRPAVCTLMLNTGQRLSISARDVDGGLDPVLALIDPAGALVAFNDDHNSDDLSLNVLDARIADFTAAADGVYQVRVSDFGGQAGMVALRITPAP
jgi:hypothetical protein